MPTEVQVFTTQQWWGRTQRLGMSPSVRDGLKWMREPDPLARTPFLRRDSSRRESPSVPAPHPPEFRRRAVELAHLREKPIADIAKDLGISESCRRNWMSRAEVDQGRKEGL